MEDIGDYFQFTFNQSPSFTTIDISPQNPTGNEGNFVMDYWIDVKVVSTTKN